MKNENIDNWVDGVITLAVEKSKEEFQKKQLNKKRDFCEIIHAAFILDTSVTFFLTRPQPTERELSWIAHTYPNSLINQGNDQGANYCTITPKF